jgi:streptogramin lyase
MLALYRSARQAEALAAYRDTRRVLAGELGIEPSRGLRDLEAKMLRHDPSLEPPPPQPDEARAADGQAPTRRRARRLRKRASATMAGLLALAATLVYAFAIRPTGALEPVTLAGDSVAVVDPSSGTISGEVPVGGRPGGLAVGEGAVWVGNRDDKTLLKIDPISRDVVRTIGLGVTPDFVRVGAGSVWVASKYDRRVVRVDPDVGSAVATITLPGVGACCMFDVETGANAIWASFGALPSLGGLWRINPATNTVTAAGHANVAALTSGAQAVWGLGEDAILRIDPRTEAVVDAVRPGRIGLVADCQDLAAGDGAVWVINQQGKTMWKIEPRDNRLSRIVELGRAPVGLAVGRGAVWVATADKHLLRVDERSGSVESISLGVYAAYQSIAVGEGAVWLSVTTI